MRLWYVLGLSFILIKTPVVGQEKMKAEEPITHVFYSLGVPIDYLQRVEAGQYPIEKFFNIEPSLMLKKESLSLIDDQLKLLFKQKSLDRQLLLYMVSGYFGEILRREVNGTWAMQRHELKDDFRGTLYYPEIVSSQNHKLDYYGKLEVWVMLDSKSHLLSLLMYHTRPFKLNVVPWEHNLPHIPKLKN